MRTYDQDYCGWAEDAASAIAEGRWNELEQDRELLADEVLDLGNRERDRLESALRVLLLHLLKLAYQPEKRTPSWDASIRVQRKHAAKYLTKNPSLRPQLAELLEDAYDDARIEAANETGLVVTTFPESCEWSIEDVLGGLNETDLGA